MRVDSIPSSHRRLTRLTGNFSWLMAAQDSILGYVGAATLVVFLAYGLRCVFKLYASGTKASSKQIRLSRSQVMEIACNLAKMSTRYPDNAQKCINLVQKYDLDINLFLPHVGLTIFLSSCIGGHTKLVHTFLENDADVSIRSNGGDSPLYLAIAGYFCWPCRHFKIFRQLIDAGCSVDDANAGGYTPLHLAASHGDIKLIEFLLEEGANPSRETFNHSLPIDMAVEAGNLKAAELLDTKHRPQKLKYYPRASTPISAATRLFSPPRQPSCQACNGKGSQSGWL